MKPKSDLQFWIATKYLNFSYYVYFKQGLTSSCINNFVDVIHHNINNDKNIFPSISLILKQSFLINWESKSCYFF